MAESHRAADIVISAQEHEVFTDDFIKAQERMWKQLQSSKKLSPSSVSHPVEEGESSLPATPAQLPLSGETGQPGMEAIPSDLSQLLEDESMIEEQQRLLERIQQEREDEELCQRMSNSWPAAKAESPEAFHGSFSNATHATDASTKSLSTVTTATMTDNASSSSLLASSSARRPPPANEFSSETRYPTEIRQKNSSMAKRSSTFHQSDQTLRMGNRNLQVKGTRHAYDAISSGSATIVQCSSCQAILQVGSSAKLLYCVHCHQVTPIEIARSNINGGRVGATDARIAKQIQNQEYDVAMVRKAAAYRRQDRPEP